jgi:hypothetical protein
MQVDEHPDRLGDEERVEAVQQAGARVETRRRDPWYEAALDTRPRAPAGRRKFDAERTAGRLTVERTHDRVEQRVAHVEEPELWRPLRDGAAEGAVEVAGEELGAGPVDGQGAEAGLLRLEANYRALAVRRVQLPGTAPLR